MRKNDLLEGLGQLKMRPWINTGDVALGIMSEHNNYLESTMKRIENTEDEETIRLLFKGLKYEAMSMHFRFMRALKENEVEGSSFQDKVDEVTFNEVTEHILKFLGGIEKVHFNDKDANSKEQGRIKSINAFGGEEKQRIDKESEFDKENLNDYKKMIVTLQGTDREIDLWETIKVFSSDDYEREDEYVRFMRLLMDKTYPIKFYNSLVKPLITKASQKEQDGDYLVMEVSEEDAKQIITDCNLNTVNKIDGCKKVLCIIYFIK